MAMLVEALCYMAMAPATLVGLLAVGYWLGIPKALETATKPDGRPEHRTWSLQELFPSPTLSCRMLYENVDLSWWKDRGVGTG